MSAILDLCDRWDALSKGETETTKAIREAYRADMGECGQRAVRRFLGLNGIITGTCVLPRFHKGDHRDATGDTWTESIR